MGGVSDHWVGRPLTKVPSVGDVRFILHRETLDSERHPMNQRLTGTLIAYGFLAMALLPILMTIQAIPGE